MLFLREMGISDNAPVVTPGTKERLMAAFPLKARMHHIFILAARVCAALALVAATTFFFSRIVPVNAATAGFFYLVAILLIATKGGLVESTIASVAAMLCLNFFFLPPVRAFTIADPQNWIALFAFLATSLTASHLSAHAKRRTQEVLDRQNEMEKLYSLSRSLLLTAPNQSMAGQMVQQIVQAFEFSSFALYVRGSGEIYRAGISPGSDIDAKMREAAVRSEVVRDEESGLVVTPIRLGGEPIGSLAASGGSLSDAAINSLLNLVAIGLERTSAQEAVNRAEVAKQSEELKSTLLDAIAHEFKTPLTSIKAVTTDLLSGAPDDLHKHQRELIGIVDESTDRLSKLVTDAIQLARIEGGTFRLNPGVYFPSSLIFGAVRQMKSMMDDRNVEVSASDDLPLVRVDGELIQMVITHLLDNALKYSPSTSPILISAGVEGNEVIIHVADHGPGISDEEQSRIFEKFYRGNSERHLRGTGMGLAIAREIIRAHDAEIWVTSRPGQGSVFSFTLPIAPGRNEG